MKPLGKTGRGTQGGPAGLDPLGRRGWGWVVSLWNSVCSGVPGHSGVT